MRTQYVSTLQLDQARLAKDLEHALTFKFSEAYSNYLIGGPWKSAMLWATGGDEGDGLLTNYDYQDRSTFTEYGRQLPYIQEIITSVANTTRLTFVRLAVFAKSVIVPHRDYIELAEIPQDARSAHRLHIPLATHEDCFFSEDNQVYRMQAGEVWHFDASQIHSVASFSAEPRIHIIFDFADRPQDGPILTIPDEGNGTIEPGRIVQRPPLPDAERAALARLSTVLTMDTFNEVFAIVVKTHFRRDGGDGFVWETMLDLSRASADPAVLPHATELHQYFTLDRPSGSGQA
ncbi:aspartyl/asparaginyl beta-hydroxylase domain-containing protein [Streptosporangium canum]|uniref:aspartyl/asparaginyl beta-hydroxylase domain-containing protein n=1 Tax=Streptosporangium canum TaxID=324952 RepID=UPI0033AF0FB5